VVLVSTENQQLMAAWYPAEEVWVCVLLTSALRTFFDVSFW